MTAALAAPLAEDAGAAVATKVAPKAAGAKAAPKKMASTKAGSGSAVPSKTTSKDVVKGQTASPAKKNSKTIKTIKSGAKKGQSFNSKFQPKQKPIKSVVTYRHILSVEFFLGVFLILTTKNSSNTHSVVMQAAAFIFIWIILFFGTTGGAQAARMCAALGGLVLLTLAMKNYTVLTRLFGSLNSSANTTITAGDTADNAAGTQREITGG